MDIFYYCNKYLLITAGVCSGTNVRLWSEDGPEAKVVGLDDHGFLQVSSPDHGPVSVQPDGNSFDMLRNLVITKHN